ncbi:unnamed protein product [Peronospora belbahrii]|uniref:DUF4536 domain-containing protein n=1 Tax=Peronospora belbahrii TaxID=622444 RepID=A0AAU9LHQ2_9STRA|nr:unnamed protein product [Peronospora belbahrii]CAH0518190.1 unnamed protein product [Peronospora belbahrii]
MSPKESMEDCLGCRLTGSLTLRSKLPRHDLKQRRWLLACAGTFVAAGIWRGTTHLFDSPTHSSLDDTQANFKAQP